MLKLYTILIAFMLCQLNAEDTPFSVFTEELHPLAYTEKEVNKGITIDITKALFKEAGLDHNIYSFPWARSYHLVQQEKNSFVVPIIRSQKREKLFHWIGPLISFKSYFYKLKKRKEINLQSWDELKHYRIGVVNQYNSHQLLLQYDKDKEIFIDTANSKSSNLKKLIHGRVDLIPSLPFTMQKTVLSEGLTMDILEATIPMKENDYYLGVNLKTDPQMINKLEQSLKKLQETGALLKILEKYHQALSLIPTTK